MKIRWLSQNQSQIPEHKETTGSSPRPEVSNWTSTSHYSTLIRLFTLIYTNLLTSQWHSQQFFRWIYDVNTRTYSGEPLMVGRAIWSAANMALKLGRNSFSWCRTACNPFSIGTGKSGRNTTDRAWSGGNRGIRYYTEKAGECSPAALLCSLESPYFLTSSICKRPDNNIYAKPGILRNRHLGSLTKYLWKIPSRPSPIITRNALHAPAIPWL